MGVALNAQQSAVHQLSHDRAVLVGGSRVVSGGDDQGVRQTLELATSLQVTGELPQVTGAGGADLVARSTRVLERGVLEVNLGQAVRQGLVVTVGVSRVSTANNGEGSLRGVVGAVRVTAVIGVSQRHEQRTVVVVREQLHGQSGVGPVGLGIQGLTHTGQGQVEVQGTTVVTSRDSLGGQRTHHVLEGASGHRDAGVVVGQVAVVRLVLSLTQSTGGLLSLKARVLNQTRHQVTPGLTGGIQLHTPVGELVEVVLEALSLTQQSRVSGLKLCIGDLGGVDTLTTLRSGARKRVNYTVKHDAASVSREGLQVDVTQAGAVGVAHVVQLGGAHDRAQGVDVTHGGGGAQVVEQVLTTISVETEDTSSVVEATVDGALSAGTQLLSDLFRGTGVEQLAGLVTLSVSLTLGERQGNTHTTRVETNQVVGFVELADSASIVLVGQHQVHTRAAGAAGVKENRGGVGALGGYLHHGHGDGGSVGLGVVNGHNRVTAHSAASFLAHGLTVSLGEFDLLAVEGL